VATLSKYFDVIFNIYYYVDCIVMCIEDNAIFRGREM
jgi:hypothetical protein